MKKKLINLTRIVLILLAIGIAMRVDGVQIKKDSILTGIVLEANNKLRLPGAMVLVDGFKISAVADEKGEFSLALPQGSYSLTISYVGYHTEIVQVSIPRENKLEILLRTEEIGLDHVEVVSTGYQKIPKERVTGSFSYLDQDLVDRRVSTGILDRMEDVTPGLIFNRAAAGDDPISIRGRSTLFGNTQPLIVIDNLPYEGNIDNLNPNDVASITVLKDAAAASIWGAQAGNGVIVITTKSGRYGQEMQVAIQSNVTLTNQPDLFYLPLMQMRDFIAQERRLFDSGYYDSRISSSAHSPLSPVVETLLAAREGRLNQQEADAKLSQYESQDSRSELSRYYYRPAILQQYAFQVTGGGKAHRFNFSGGYDQNKSEQVGRESGRITLNARQDWKLLREKLEISTGVYLSRGSSYADTGVPSLYPYEALADAQGNPLAVVSQINTRFVEENQGKGLLDWSSIPLNELGKRNERSLSMDIRANLGLNYKILPGLNAQLYYQYWNNSTELRNIESEDLFAVRHQINSFTQTGEDGTLSLLMPRGSRFSHSNGLSFSHNLRANLTYNFTKNSHEVNALAGWELRDMESYTDRMIYYGYDDAIGLSTPVDYTSQFPQYQNWGSYQSIPYGGTHSGNLDRYVSYFANVGYSYSKKYLLTLSARKDMSNLFGVETNQRGIPLWSAGAGWILSEEDFYGWQGMPYLKVRMSYGYNGNVDKATSAYTTLMYYNDHPFVSGLRYAFIANPPNPELRWEKIRIVNVGLDFESKSGRIGGTLEFYSKVGEDLIGETEVPDSNGIYQYRGNFSGTQTQGFDLLLNSLNLDRSLKWNTQFLMSGMKDKVTYFDGARATAQYLAANSNMIPLEGRPLFSVFSYPWGGLDPTNGNPLGYLDGELSDDYSAIMASSTTETLKFHGSARPTLYGSLRNTLDWKGWNISLNISYRLGYYYRRRSVDYAALSRGEISHSDYGLRWQNPGDELLTNVPSQPDGLDNQRASFYQFSSTLVEKGDNVRLQDIRLGYSWNRSKSPTLPVRGIEVFTYLNNLGILWKVSNDTVDPDFPVSRPLRSAALGLRIDL
ncbi:SusC/RagA family TonB-linked outer membrane protein [uncultured Algoriphagus sp.]|uniref:SusC/RagA family TonB-linked outer membrane protein n=1 Tax=uncultured Algoriphagus sp. TaxID=417365 RepID=UPI0030EC25CA|tara:strand:- start:6050 stop:9250 length:3201 start_codon:yes stop_codon:yes gene_type:complete